MKNLLLVLFIVLSLPVMSQPIPQKLDSLLNSEILSSSEYGITIFDLTDGTSIYKYQDQKLFRPASVEKIITTVTAIDKLGENYTFDTKVFYTGDIKDGTLNGNLYIIGGFDPEFMEKDMDMIVDAIKKSGIKHISDSLIFDVSMKDSAYWGPGWAWDDAGFSFQPYLSPLMVNRGCVDVTVYPMRRYKAPRIKSSPQSNYYKIINKAQSRNKGAGKLLAYRNYMDGGNDITVTGNAAYITTKRVSVSNSAEFFVNIFVSKLSKEGINANSYEFGELLGDSTSTSLVTLQRPFQKVLDRALKKSDNLSAEAILFNLAAKSSNKKRVGFKDGVEAINSFIKKSLGFNPTKYNIVDGCGISTYNYVSPELILEFLKYAYYHQNVFYSFYNALPIAGVDGTMRNRLRNSDAHGNLRAKTGSLTGVSSLAGYVKAKNGHQYAFVIINQNFLSNKKAHIFQDKICNILVE